MKDEKRDDSSKTNFIHLFVSLPTNDVCSLRDLSTKLLIHQVKSRIELRVGIPGDLIHLYFMNNEMIDNKTLEDYPLRYGSILRVRLHKTWLGLFVACSKGDAFEVFQNGVQEIRGETSNDFDTDLWNKLVVKRATFALFMATYHGYLSLMLELLNSSAADINGCTIFGRTALHIAANQGFVGCVSLLLSEGAESSSLDVFGKTPLQLAHSMKHIYCQKRLYMHQTSENWQEKSRGTRKTEHRPKTAPHQMIKNFQQNHQARSHSSKEPSSESLPSITTTSRDHPISAQIPKIPSQSYDLPVMTIIEPTKTRDPGDKISHQTPIVRPQTAPMRSGEDLSVSCSSSRGMRGIDAILKTSQDDIVGEYHNIDESLANMNITTLRSSLLREENIHTDFKMKPNEAKTSAESSNKKVIGFLLQAEVNRNRGEQGNNSEEMNDRPVTTETDSSLMTENGNTDEKLWKPTSNGFSDLNDQRDQLWIPGAFGDVGSSETERAKERRRATSLSYEEWLERKRHSLKDERRERPASASEKLRSKVGRELDAESFQRWLEEKKKFRKRSKSEIIESHRTSSGVPFEEWLRQKRQQLNATMINSQSLDAEMTQLRPKQVNLGGKTFGEWLAEKRKTCHDRGETTRKPDHKRVQSGKTFREWLKDKKDEKQKHEHLQESLAGLELQKKALLDEQRKLNPRVKTFEEWFEEKRAQSVIDFIQSKNIPHESGLLNCKTKFPEDACLVYDMWLTSKNVEELEKEEKLYEKMVEKWRRKEQERLLIRRSILSKLNQTKKVT